MLTRYTALVCKFQARWAKRAESREVLNLEPRLPFLACRRLQLWLFGTSKGRGHGAHRRSKLRGAVFVILRAGSRFLDLF